MHRQSHEEVAAAARRRLDLLGRELDAAGLRRLDPAPPEQEETEEAAGALPDPARVPPAGRHLRPPRPGPGARLGSRVGGWLGDQLPDTLRGRVQLEAGPAVVVLALVALAAIVTAFVLVRTGGDAEAVPEQPQPVTAGSTAPLVPTGSPTVAATAGPSTVTTAGASAVPVPSSGASVTVDVAGKVRRPGVATLPAGSRVVDALEQAGGPRGRVDLTGLNLARVLVDGEQILVGRAAGAAAGAGVPGGQPGGLAASASTAAPGATGPLVNLNTATAEQLDTLPGVGPVTAQKILDWRAAHGAFSSVDELLEVDGIGDKTLADIAPHVTL